MEHSVLGASGSGRWMSCPGSVRLCKKAPRQKESKFAAEGTEAHAVAEHCLLPFQLPSEIKEGPAAFPSFEYVTEEMLSNLDIYVKTIWDFRTEGTDLEIEKKFNLDWLFPGMFGTNDACVSEPNGALHIFDLKYGMGIQVEAEDNTQLKYYALGALGEFNEFNYQTVTMTIIQPRGYHPDGPVRTAEMTVDELYEWATMELLPAAKATQEADAPLVCGEWCDKYFCDAKAICPEMSKCMMALAKQDFKAVLKPGAVTITLPPPETLTLDELAKVIEASSLMASWAKEVQAYAQTQHENGNRIPHHKLVRGRSNRKFIDDRKVVEQLEFLYGERIYAPKKLKTVKQMESVIQDKWEIDGLWEKPEGKLSLVHESDRRAEVENKAQIDFEPVNKKEKK